MSVVDRIRDVLSGETDRVQPAPSEQSGPSKQGGPSEPTETYLYRCDPCDTTYVSDELDSCSRCDAPVERIPTGRDLGLI